MKHILYLTLFVCILLGSCQANKEPNNLYEEGISLELAQLRKQEIKDLKYSLRFSIPEQKQEAVEGETRIQFTIQKPQEIILDFRESADKVKEVSVNGQPTEYTFLNEHIILPQSSTIEGKNEVYIRFTAGNQSLNRNDEFLYTLLVPDRARTVFPCFEQPNLKAAFTLQLEVPTEWEAVSNTSIASENTINGKKHITFLPTEPLSTYLFSFVAGKLKKVEYADGERILTAYHRETDPKKVTQLNDIFEQVASSLHWLEDYTDVPYPFAKYSFIILPGFQYGGMEHTGATLYNDNSMFLSEHPTLDEELARAKLIAHETAHMWFGDFVTMDWFNDVWTKEVFANYFAACIVEPLFPSVNHSLNWIKTYTAASLSEDRTLGSNSIRQPLDNLRNAGLIYGNIIYNKAPVMMQKLVEIMGEEAYQGDALNKPLLASYLFADADNAARINAIVHPRVKADFHRWLSEHQDAEIAGLECAILYEAGFEDTVNKVVMVYAPESLRIERAMKRDNATEAQIRARIAAQMDDEEKCSRADYVIYTDGRIPLEEQLCDLIKHIKTNK